MPNQLTTKGPLYWAVPLTVAAAATVYTVKKINASAMVSQPLRFIPSGEPKYDSANLDRIRADWHTKNNGMGLRDVSRSGGGV